MTTGQEAGKFRLRLKALKCVAAGVGGAAPIVGANLRPLVRRKMHGETWRRHWPKGHPLLAPRFWTHEVGCNFGRGDESG
jgi:hypothetical protein